MLSLMPRQFGAKGALSQLLQTLRIRVLPETCNSLNAVVTAVHIFLAEASLCGAQFSGFKCSSCDLSQNERDLHRCSFSRRSYKFLSVITKRVALNASVK